MNCFFLFFCKKKFYFDIYLKKTKKILDELKTLRTSTSTIAKSFASKASNTTNAIVAKEIMDEAVVELEKLYLNSVLFLILF
jgi:hypothetical protein